MQYRLELAFELCQIPIHTRIDTMHIVYEWFTRLCYDRLGKEATPLLWDVVSLNRTAL